MTEEIWNNLLDNKDKINQALARLDPKKQKGSDEGDCGGESNEKGSGGESHVDEVPEKE